VRFAVRVRGGGRTEVAAYGVADAEHQVEKEILRLWPDARVRVLEVRRSGAAAERIAEEFVVEYRLEGVLEVDAPDEAAARAEVFRTGRDRLQGSRYWRIAWEAAEVRGVKNVERAD